MAKQRPRQSESPESSLTNAHDAREAVGWAHVSELKPNPRNPRKHGPEVLKLARTILRTAWGAPIVAQRSTRRIIGGHGRLEAAREILAGIEVDGELRGGAGHWFDRSAPGPEMVPVRWVDVSDAEADAMTLADNARALQGFDDPVAVVEMAAQFGRESETMRDIGLDADALDAMVKAAGDAVIASERGASPEDLADNYADRTIKRVTLFFDADGYDDFIKRADALLEARGLEDYTALVVELVTSADA